MGMKIDQPRRDQRARGIESPRRAFGGNSGLDRGDPAMTNSDIAPSPQTPARIDNLAAGNHQIELRPILGQGGGA